MTGAIWLRRHGDTVEVLLENEGHWFLLIREFTEAPISHIIEPDGIAKALRQGTPSDA